MNEILKELISHIELPTDHLSDQDPEIVEIFIEEVQEILEFLDGAIPHWLKNPTDTAILKDIRRSYHTLKGSGRMAGAVQSGELAWSIEEMLNRVMANTVDISPDIQHLVYSVAKLYPILVDDFQKLQVHQLEFRPWIVAAQQLRDGQDLAPVLRFTIDYYQDQRLPDEDTEDNTIAIPSELMSDEVEHLVPVAELETQPVEALEAETIDSIQQTDLALDSQMLEIFLEESNEHLYTIAQFLQLQDIPSVEQYNQLIRAIHTIRGSSGMVGFDQIFVASTHVENTFKNLSQETDAHNEIEQQLLLEYYEYVKSYTTVLSAEHTDYDKLGELNQQFDHVWSEFEQLSQLQNPVLQSQGLVAQLLDLDINELLDAEFSFSDELHQQQHVYLATLVAQADILLAHTGLRQTDSLHKIVEHLKQSYQALEQLTSFDDHQAIVDRVQELHQYLIDAFDGLASGQNIAITHLLIEDFDANLIEIQSSIDVDQAEIDQPIVEESATTVEETITEEAIIEEVAPKEAEEIVVEPSTTEQLTEQVSTELNAEDDWTIQAETQQVVEQPTVAPQPANTNFDADLLSIFLEESDELVVGMDEDFNTWEKDTQNTHVLKNLFRYLHTLKGGANMVQATHLGMVAHELETIYERVLKGTFQPNAQAVQMIRYAQDDIATRLQVLRDQFIDEDNPQLIAQLRAIYNEQPTRSATPVDQTSIKHKALELTEDATEVAIAEPQIDIEVEHAQPANVDFDSDLLMIFLEESEELVAGMDEDFNTWEKDTKNTHVLKNLFRYLHTLKGGANMVQATHLGMVAHELETIYERVLKGMIHPSQTAVQTIRYAQDDIAIRLQRLREASIDEDNPQLIAQLRAVSMGGQLSSSASRVEEAEFEAHDVIESVPDVLSEAPSTVSEASIDELSVIESSVVSSSDDMDDEQLPPVLAEVMRSGDEEKIIIVQSFYEEAEELLQEGQVLFDQWINDRGNRSLMLSLQRIYHTIKGNARLIEQQLIGLMAYQLELVFEQMSIHEFKSDRYNALIKQTQQWLHAAIFQGRFDGAESLKSRLQAIEYQGALIPEDSQRVVTETIDFSSYEQAEFIEGDGVEPPPMYAQVEQKQDQGTQELIRVSADLVEKLIDLSGENAINRSRIELDLGQMTYTLSEMELAIHRLADQLRRMEGELEAQILAKHESEGQRYVDFDPLEMDQYSSLNQLSKSLAESASDLIDFKTTLADKIRDTENLLLQQSRIHTELQQSLMGTRLVPFARLVPRLQRLVRQTSTQLNRPVELNIENTEGELDRNILERLVSPLEHMLRNAIDHGIEEQETRANLGKPVVGNINLNIAREGNDILVIFSDDGRGIDVQAVKTKAENNGLITADMQLSDVDIMQYIFNSGLSTAQKVTQISGRGVGLDVVQSEIKALGGHVSVNSIHGKGTEFTIRVPTSVAVSNALMVKVGDQQFAIPLAQIERIVRVSPVALMEYYDSKEELFELDDVQYRLRYIGEFITGQYKPTLTNMGSSVPVIIYNSGGRVVALQVDQLVGSRAQIVIKPIGQQLSSVGYVGGATILADGRVCLILDGQAVARRVLTVPRHTQVREEVVAITSESRVARRTVMVVDDSVTVRKVTSRLLERQGFDVITAKDGVDAIELLAQVTPDLMLLDIEMPRMDGFEVAQYVRHDSNHKALPIIMITSRTGEKHRERAFDLGVNKYMGKPFQEAELLENIKELLLAIHAEE